MKNKYFLVLILLVTLIFWIWWLPGLKVANDFSFISNDWLKLQFDIPRAWNERGAEGLGEYGVFTLWSYPVNYIFGILANLGLNFQIWERILVILFILLGSWSIWKFLSQYTLSNKSKFIGSLFYLINTYPLLLIDGGQISIALAYGLFPFVFLQIYKALYLRMKEKILAGLFSAVLGFFDLRFLFVLFLLLLIRALFDILEHIRVDFRKVFWKWTAAGLTIILTVGFLNAYWLIPYLKVPLDGDVFASFTSISKSLLNIGHPILVISPHWFKNVFGQISELKAEFILLPILAFIAPVLRRKDKNVLFWLFTAVFSIFLAKGGSEPLAFIYPWLHSNIPGFSLFRDSTKFFFLVSLSYVVLLSISSEEILRICKKVKTSSIGEKLATLYLFFTVIYLLFLIKPIFLNQMTGTFSIHPLTADFQSVTNVLQNDKNSGRVFWIPGTAPLSYSDLNHPIVEAARVFNRSPFVFGVEGSYEVFNFLREASYMGEIFDISGISYIAYPYPDIRRDRLSQDDIEYYYNFLNQLTSLSWIDKKIPESKIPLLKTKNHQDKIFITQNTWIVFGTDEIFKDSTKSAKLALRDNAIIFAESQPEMGLQMDKYPEAKIVLNNKSFTDLLASFIPKSKIIFPASELMVDPNSAGWWKNNGKNIILWNDFLKLKYGISSNDFDLGGGWAIGEGSLELRVQDERLKNSKVLFARVMESSRSGSLSFYQDSTLVGSINTKARAGMVKWFEIGTLQRTANLIIKTEGDINVINALAVIDQEDLLSFKNKSENLFKQISDFKPDTMKSSTATVSFQKVNQTKYKLQVSGLTYPQMIVFSSSFHPLWKLNGEKAILAYGFLNGFRVDKDGLYILNFEPQRYIEVGLAISILSFLFIIFYLLRRKGGC